VVWQQTTGTALDPSVCHRVLGSVGGGEVRAPFCKLFGDLFCSSSVWFPSIRHKLVHSEYTQTRTAELGCRPLATASLIYTVIQGKVSIFGGDSIAHCDKKNVYMNMCLILNGYRNRDVWISRPNSVIFLFVGLDEVYKTKKKKGGYTKRIARSHFGCCCPYKETRKSPQTNNTRSSHTSCKVHWGWRWDFRTFIVNCNKFVTSV
jgi:hypothetical protein